MTTGGETADQVVRMSLQGIEVAAEIALKAGGMASKSLAAMLYAILTDQKKVKGRTRLDTMLKSGKELKVFAIRHDDLKLFCQEAKRYGVLYCVLKEKHNKDGICDVMVRAEDAAKISRIVDKFELATVDTKTIRDSVLAQRSQKDSQLKDVSVMSDEQHDSLVQSLMNSMKTKERSENRNPETARMIQSGNQSGHTFKRARVEPATTDQRPSVRNELNQIISKRRKMETKGKKPVRARRKGPSSYKNKIRKER